MNTQINEQGTEDCPICMMELNTINFCVTICNHKFHTSCLLKSNGTCPLCRNHLVEKPVIKKHTPASQHRDFDARQAALMADYDARSTGYDSLNALIMCLENSRRNLETVVESLTPRIHTNTYVNNV